MLCSAVFTAMPFANTLRRSNRHGMDGGHFTIGGSGSASFPQAEAQVRELVMLQYARKNTHNVQS